MNIYNLHTSISNLRRNPILHSQANKLRSGFFWDRYCLMFIPIHLLWIQIPNPAVFSYFVLYVLEKSKLSILGTWKLYELRFEFQFLVWVFEKNGCFRIQIRTCSLFRIQTKVAWIRITSTHTNLYLFFMQKLAWDWMTGCTFLFSRVLIKKSFLLMCDAMPLWTLCIFLLKTRCVIRLYFSM